MYNVRPVHVLMRDVKEGKKKQAKSMYMYMYSVHVYTYNGISTVYTHSIYEYHPLFNSG